MKLNLFSLLGITPPEFTLPDGLTVTAHTACEGADDNTLESISRGAAAGADIVEIDLHFLPDNTPVLKHDAPTASEAGKLPTMESALELLSTLNVRMNIDVKSTADMLAVAALAEKYNVKDKVFFTGVEEKDTEAVRTGAPGIPYYLNVKIDKKKNADPAYISSLVEKVKACGAIGINAKYTGCSKKLINAFRKEGIPVSLWTANTKKAMYRCLALEPDNITTRFPSVLCGIIKK